MNDIANLSLEFIVWLLRIALVGLIYLFVWRIFRIMIRGDQNKPAFVGTNAFLVLQRTGETLKSQERQRNTTDQRQNNDARFGDHGSVIRR